MKTSLLLALALLSYLTATASFASTETLAPHKAVLHRPTLVEGSFPQSIDHFGQLPGRTFPQRYWVDSQFAANPSTAPVIFHICGEGNVERHYFLTDNAIGWARELGAHIVYLEHRYYGESMPFADLSSPSLRYLTLDNVIEDLASFQRSLTESSGWTGPWIAVGGSYSGTLAAIYRQKHPELVVGALASSAPMASGADAWGSASLNDDHESARQWTYQACTTFLFWEAHGSSLMAPSADLCRRTFGNVTLANSATYNARYYYPYLSEAQDSPSNILFTYGSRDVWTRLGLPAAQNRNPKITIHWIAGAGHHDDLNGPVFGDSVQVQQARAAFTRQARAWLAP